MFARPLLALLLATPACARTLTVGPGQQFEGPAAAARTAQDGDTVLIQPGEYYECAIWPQNRLTIAGAGPGAVITDATCQNKAAFVVQGNDTTITDLTLARARVYDGNGAGIRLEGQGLTLDRVRFDNNEVGLLAGAPGPGAIRITDCTFQSGGAGGDRPTFAVWVGATALLRIENSRFAAIKGGQIATTAERTELVHDTIATGAGEAPSVAVAADGATLLMEDNTFTVGPIAPARAAAIWATGGGPLILRRNRLDNQTGHPLALLLDWTGATPVLDANQLQPGDTAVSRNGIWRHRASTLYHATKDGLLDLARLGKRRLYRLIGK